MSEDVPLCPDCVEKQGGDDHLQRAIIFDYLLEIKNDKNRPIPTNTHVCPKCKTKRWIAVMVREPDEGD